MYGLSFTLREASECISTWCHVTGALVVQFVLLLYCKLFLGAQWPLPLLMALALHPLVIFWPCALPCNGPWRGVQVCRCQRDWV